MIVWKVLFADESSVVRRFHFCWGLKTLPCSFAMSEDCFALAPPPVHLRHGRQAICTTRIHLRSLSMQLAHWENAMGELVPKCGRDEESVRCNTFVCPFRPLSTSDHNHVERDHSRSPQMRYKLVREGQSVRYFTLWGQAVRRPGNKEENVRDW